ncbi:MAG: ABC transporter ATP-binding protein [Bacteroidota bacterium]
MEECFRLESVAKHIGKRCIIEEISLFALQGEVCGLLGPNGAGKTTTIRLLLGLLKPTRGSILVFGRPVTSDRRPQNARIGFVLDRHGLYLDLTARDNLRLFGSLLGLRSGEIALRTEEIASRLGLQARLDDKVRTFSKGMRQKLAITRSLLHRPAFLIYDEPTAGLDPSMQVEIRRLIMDLSRSEGVTVFLASHYLHEVEEICSRVAIIAEGRLRAFGGLPALLNAARGPAVEFTIRPEGGTPGWAAAVKGINGVKGADMRGDRLVVELEHKEAAPLVYQHLMACGADVVRMQHCGTSLEDLYLSVTGGMPGEDGQPGPH